MCCVFQQATVATFPTLRGVLTRLLFASDVPVDSASPGGSASKAPETPPTFHRVSPSERYYILPAEDKVAILAFLCDAVVSHKEIHTYMDTCEANLTQLRKEKIEVKKERKKM